MKHMIEISRDMIILGIEKESNTMNVLNTIFVLEDRISLRINQRENQNKMDMFVNISNDEIVCDISSITDEYQKDIIQVLNAQVR